MGKMIKLTRNKTRYLVIIIFVLLIGAGISSQASNNPSSSDKQGYNVHNLDNSPPPITLKSDEVNPKLQTVLQELTIKQREGLMAARTFSKEKNIPLSNGQVIVIIEPTNGLASSIDQSTIRKFGGSVEATSTSLLRAKIPVKNLVATANNLPQARFIRLPYKPNPLKFDISQGVSKTDALNFHHAGYYGQNTKVAIIDIGFDNLTEAMDSGDVDPIQVVFTHDYTSDHNLESGGRHGTGVAEIIYDMAPQAKLYLMKIGDAVDLENAKEYAVSKGIDVVNHSVGWYNTSYYDGTGIISNIASNAFNNGILWVNSAGNEANLHWQGNFVDSDGDGWAEFSNGDECNSLGTMGYGSQIDIYMTWNAWSYEPEDYNIYLYNDDSQQVASSTDLQTGTQHPTEYLSYNTSSTGNFCFAVYNKSAPTTPQIEIFLDSSPDRPSLQYGTEASSIVDPANDEKVFTIGAIDVNNWVSGPQESFSSLGPTNNSKFATAKIKPDLMGPDGVTTYGYGTFYGTSASSPHVAGAAALLLSKNPSTTPGKLQSRLESLAIDMGITGKDNTYGAGRLNLNVSMPEDPTIYEVLLAVSSPHYSDNSNYFGTSSTALDCKDNEDNLEPLPGQDYTRLFFSLPETCSYHDPLSKDMKSSIACGLNYTSWNVTIETTEPAETQINLSWNSTDVIAVPGECSITLYDLHEDQSVNMRNTTNYSFTTTVDNTSREFKVTVGKDPCQVITTQLQAGWNLFSIYGNPVLCEGTNPSLLFEDDFPPGLKLFRWNLTTEEYDDYPSTGMEIIPGYGQWVYLSKGTEVDAIVSPVDTNYSLELTGIGWHMIGAPFPITWGDVKINGIEISNQIDQENYEGPLGSYIFAWVPGSGYAITRPQSWNELQLQKWQGYWVQTEESQVNITFPAGVAINSSSPQSYVDNFSNFKKTGNLNVPRPPAPPHSEAIKNTRITVNAAPNPVSDSSLEFHIAEDLVNISAIKVQVYSTLGRCIFESGYVNGRSLTWNLVEKNGKVADNGLYLYRVKARDYMGKVRTSGFKRLLVVR